MEPVTVWQEQDGVLSGGAGMIRAASFPSGDLLCGAVTLTVRVPDGFWQQIDGGGASATLMLNPDEARGFAAWLAEAAAAADAVGPPLFV